MRASVYLLVSTVVFLGSALAMPGAKAEDASLPNANLPCVEVQVGQDRMSQMNCINQALKRVVEHEHNAPQPEAPVTAQSASNTVGVYNDAAAREMMGNAFGVSAKPQRPDLSYSSPLIHTPH